MSKEKVEKEIRRPSFAEGLIPILFMAFILVLGMGILKWPAEICLLLAALFAGAIAMARLNYDWDKIQQLIIEKISIVMPAVLIVIFVGFMVATWSYSGTMGMLVYYGVKFINPTYAFAIAFIACAILSYVSGASWGSVASIGVALMGIGNALQLNSGILAAAIVTGAYFGDKLSPLSDTTNLTSAVNNVKLYDLIKYLLYTTLPATIFAIIMYFILGLNQHLSGSVNVDDIQLLTDLTSIYKFGIWPLIPMLVILLGTLMRMPTIPAMLASSVTAILTGGLYQGFDWLVGVKCAMKGFDVS
ncbi:MAG TPA: Na+/H+ antiporter NhaC family protein, partial [Anaerovoracaceae bacterium]|nr:Na+/H+ antiporter NhaC family protein [Anaerovoracaceae bacterium]